MLYEVITLFVPFHKMLPPRLAVTMKKTNSRRSFLKNISLASASALALSGCSLEELEKFFQKNFRTLSEKEKKQLIEDLEVDYKEKYHKDFHLSDKPAIDGTLFGYALVV